MLDGMLDGMLESVQTECANSGIVAGDVPLVPQAYADDQAAASSTPISLQRILDAMKGYGDTWGCCANTDKPHILLVGLRTRPPTLDAIIFTSERDAITFTSESNGVERQ
jgi:hypothetical protein